MKKTGKMLLNFWASDWLTLDLEKHQKQHEDLAGKKDLLENYVLSLKEQILGLESQVRYLNDVSGKAAESSSEASKIASTNLHTQENPPQPPATEQHLERAALTAQEVIRPKGTIAMWKEGKWTFSQKQEQALAFADQLLAIRNEKTRELMNIRAEGQKEIERIKAEGRNTRRRQGSHSQGDGEILFQDPHGGPVDELIRTRYIS